MAATGNRLYFPTVQRDPGIVIAMPAPGGRSTDAGKGRFKRTTILALGVSLNLGLLGYFKYADFFLQNVSLAFGAEFPLLNLALPLAISFFTFQQIAYLVDSYRMGTMEYDFLNYSLFVSFFPQLIAGPIVHHQEMMPQFMRLKNSLLNWSNVAAGLFIFCIGLFKKTVIADSFAIWANAGFDAAQPLGFLDAWATSFSYTFQLYYDFSGYTDMAIGAALIFNIRLPINFNSPYKAVDIRDFWRRWHITLSRWLRDYVYIPLGGNRKGGLLTYQNILLTFLLGGLWHGAGWTFVAWGVMHGLAVAVHRFWTDLGFRLPAALGWFITFMFVNATWVFFRAESFNKALGILKAMAGLNGFALSFTQSVEFKFPRIWPVIEWMETENVSLMALEFVTFTSVFALIAFLVPNTVQMIGFVQYPGHIRFKPGITHALVIGLLFSIAVSTFIGSASPSEFLYFNF